METNKEKIVYTADDEFPDCGKCDNFCASEYFCQKQCGAEHGWFGYRRTEYELRKEKTDD